MIDSRTAAHKAVYAALTASAAVTELADVWSHPEEGTEAVPDRALVLVGFASANNLAGKDGGLDEVTIDVVIYVREPDITALYALSSCVRTALEGQLLAATGAEVSRPEFLSAEPDLMDDGETYFDTLRFRTIVQPA